MTTAVDILLRRTAPATRCVVVDEEGHSTAPTTADFLAQQGCAVAVLSRYFMVGEDLDEGVRADLYDRLFKQDAYSPRRIHDAILDGTRAARGL